MKRIAGLCFLIFFLPVVAVVAGAQEPDGTVYLQIDYLDISAEAETDFLEIVESDWKTLHDKRKDQGIITSWGMYEVLVNEPGARYNYVSVQVFDDFKQIYSTWSQQILEEVFSGDDAGETVRRLRSAYEVIDSELWQMEGEVIGDERNEHFGRYITKNYMDARGGTGEHTAMELDFWGEIHRVRIGRDILNSWAMYTMVKPSGNAVNYTYSTIDYYGRLGDIEGSVGMELAREAHPEKSQNELQDYFNRTGASRDVIKTELWRWMAGTTGE